MTEPLTFLRYMEQTVLQPPCDAGQGPCCCARCRGRRAHGCDKPATRIVEASCGCYPAMLTCGPHAAEAAAQDGIICRRCQGCLRVTVTPL